MNDTLNDTLNDSLEQKLNALHAANQPDAAFVDQLEEQLRMAQMQNTTSPVSLVKQNGQLRLRRRLLGIAASVLLIAGLFAVVPPLRTLAQTIIDFFIPSEEFALPGDDRPFTDVVQDIYSDVTMVSTIEEAEDIAGFEAMEWVNDDFKIINIQAGTAYIMIVYEQANASDHGVTLSISKYLTGTRIEQAPVGPDAEVYPIEVRGVPGQVVSGGWLCRKATCAEDEYEWLSDTFTNLYWEKDGMSYQLSVSPLYAKNLVETLAVAEALREDRPVEVATIAQAEKIAGIEALEWSTDDYQLMTITAVRNSISLVYGDGNKPVFALSQYRPGVQPKHVTIGVNAKIEPVRVRGRTGQFVKGGWAFAENSNPVWEDSAKRQLYWEQDEISYHLLMDSSVADTPEEVIAIAESLE